ncbi:hypothetical protein BDR07DRAFT_1477790 [Suillus spraguei]|nr:hypothetical protein BDR07DRAFT_1477790 [Suillus spraguei]
MSDTLSIRSTRSAPPSYSTALQHPIPEEEEPPIVAPEAPLVVLTPQTNLSTDTLVEATARPSSSNMEARGPFTFSPFGPNAMLLLPHALSSNSRPLYHISVSNDCFRPQIYTTTIRRGTEQGQVIAEIQFGLPNFPRLSSANPPPYNIDSPYYTTTDTVGLLNTKGQGSPRWPILTIYIFNRESARR